MQGSKNWKCQMKATMPTSEPEFPANLKAFCQLVVNELGYANITHVLDVLDRNFDVVQDRALDCCFDQSLAWLILSGEFE